MSKPAPTFLIVAIVLVAVVVYIGVRAFQPPVPLTKVESLTPGMRQEQVLEILGAPTCIYLRGQRYVVRGTNYTTAKQWTYQRFLKFGYVNVLFDTNGTVLYGHYEEF